MADKPKRPWTVTTTVQQVPPWILWRDEGVLMPATWTACCEGPEKIKVTLDAAIDRSTGRAICTGVRRTHDDAAPLTATVLHALPVTRLLIESARRVIADVTSTATGLEVGMFGDKPGPDAAAVTRLLEHPGRPRADSHNELLVDVVKRYRESTPRKVIARDLGYSEGYIAQLLNEARNTKPPLLGPASPGKAGEIGPPAKRRQRSRKEKP